MRLKSFTGASLPEAMKAVRDHFGPDAVILSTIDDGPGGQVRVTAALDNDAPEAADEAAPAALAAVDTLAAALSFHRVPQGLADRMLAAAATIGAEDAVLSLAGALDAEFGFKPFAAETETRPLLLLGPPGGGKTSSAAKLCALAKLAGRETTLITMDVAKAGGRDQISIYAGALKARLLEAADPDALARSVAAVDKDRLVIIDTPGANAFVPLDLEGLRAALEASGAQPVLVLPAGGDALESAEAAQAFAELGQLRIIATKLDAARRLGGVLAGAFLGGCLFSAAGIAPQIAGGLVPINPVWLARLLLPEGVVPIDNPKITEPLRAAR